MTTRRWQGILRDLVVARGGELQVAAYVAVLCGVRKCLDDWVPAERFEAFERLAASLGLAVEPDCIFLPGNDLKAVGTEVAPTTRAAGAPFRRGEEQPPGATVHVFVGTTRKCAGDALRAGWYPLAVGGRVVHKPVIDHFRLGQAFGYPDCCVAFFLRHNDWPRQNTLVEAARRTHRFCWQANCLRKFTPWMLNFHMPCSFTCPESCAQGEQTLAAIRALDAAYADEILDRHRGVFLVISERALFALRQARPVGPNRVAYTAVEELVTHAYRTERERAMASKLQQGDTLELQDGLVYVHQGGHIIDLVETRCDEGVAEVPYLLDFRG
jgi:hypothetical protein